MYQYVVSNIAHCRLLLETLLRIKLSRYLSRRSIYAAHEQQFSCLLHLLICWPYFLRQTLHCGLIVLNQFEVCPQGRLTPDMTHFHEVQASCVVLSCCQTAARQSKCTIMSRLRIRIKVLQPQESSRKLAAYSLPCL